MYVFDLFEGHEERKDAPQAAANQSSDQRGVTKGVRGDIYNNTNIAGVRRAIDQAIASEPGAKSEIEAIVSYLDKQAQTNAEQEREIERLERDEERLRKTQDDLTKDLQDKEARFREITAQLAAGKIDQQQAAKMAQDVEAGKEPVAPATKKSQATPAAPTAQSEPAQTQRPALRAVPGGAQPAGAQPAEPAAAQPAQAPAKDAGSRAFGQMARQLTPGRVIKGKATTTPEPTSTTSWAANQPTAQAKPTTGASNIKVFPGKIDPAQAKNIQDLLAAESVNEAQIKWAVPQNSSAKEIARANLNNIVLGAIAPDRPSVKMYFTDGHGPTLPYNQVAALYNYLGALNKANPATEADVQNLLSNSRYFYDRMLNDIVGQTTRDPVPQGQQVPDEDDPQAKLLEGDVVPFTDQQVVNQAYADALTFLKYAAKSKENDPMRLTMRQDFAHKYQQRFEIKLHPDGKTYYLQDKQQGKTYRLPAPDFPLEEEPYDGKNAFSDGQGQWSSENNQISSGNNPHGFSEAEVSKDKTGARMYQAKEKFLLSRDGKQIAFYDNMIQAQRDAERMQNELGGQVVVQRIMREQDVTENMPRDSIQRYLAIDAEDDVAAVKAAIHAISKDPELKPTAKARLLGQVGMIIKTHRLPIGRAYYEFMQQFMEATDYQKRRQRERDVDMGKPVKPLPRNPQTDYQKKRARDRKEMELGESHMKDLFYKAQEDLKNLTDAQFIKTHGMSKVAFQQQYRTLLKPAAQQDVPVAESKNYWHQLQEERRRKANTYVSELENVLKDIK